MLTLAVPELEPAALARNAAFVCSLCDTCASVVGVQRDAVLLSAIMAADGSNRVPVRDTGDCEAQARVLSAQTRALNGASAGVKLDLSIDVSRAINVGNGADLATQLVSLMQASTQDPATRNALWMPVLQTACSSGCSTAALEDALLFSGTASATPAVSADDAGFSLAVVIGGAAAGFAVALAAAVVWYNCCRKKPQPLSSKQPSGSPAAPIVFGQANPLFQQQLYQHSSVASYLPAPVSSAPSPADDSSASGLSPSQSRAVRDHARGPGRQFFVPSQQDLASF